MFFKFENKNWTFLFLLIVYSCFSCNIRRFSISLKQIWKFFSNKISLLFVFGESYGFLFPRSLQSSIQTRWNSIWMNILIKSKNINSSNKNEEEEVFNTFSSFWFIRKVYFIFIFYLQTAAWKLFKWNKKQKLLFIEHSSIGFSSLSDLHLFEIMQFSVFSDMVRYLKKIFSAHSLESPR